MKYVFYVSDTVSVNVYSFSYKMGTEREIAYHMSDGLGKCIVKKYTEYAGENIDAESVGIVFPARSWGISFAVNAFLQSLRIGKGTYVYGVAVGENASGDMSIKNIRSKNSLVQFKKAFTRRFIDMDKDIYVRCADTARCVEDTEYNKLMAVGCEGKVRCILKSLLYLNFEELECADYITTDRENNERKKQVYSLEESRLSTTEIPGRERIFKLTNIFLDEDIFAEDKLCRVI